MTSACAQRIALASILRPLRRGHRTRNNRQCAKVIYYTHKIADAAILKLAKIHNEPGHPALVQSYYCRYCHGWHIGHKRKEEVYGNR